MRITTILGLLLGFVSIVLGMFLKGANPMALINPAAIVVIIVGTIAALLNSYPVEDVKKIPTLFKIL